MSSARRKPTSVLVAGACLAVTLAAAGCAIGGARAAVSSPTAPTAVGPSAAHAAQNAQARSARRVVAPTTGRVFVVGDSLTVGTEPWLASALRRRGWSLAAVNARVGRPTAEGLAILRARARRLPPTVLIALGTNDIGAGAGTVRSWLREARSIVGGRRLVWVNLCVSTVAAPRLAGWRQINAWLRSDAPRYHVELADWCAFATMRHLAHAPDGIHYGPSGYQQRARFYADVLSAVPARP